MHPLHDYLAKQLESKIKSRSVVVWYDERAEFQPFVDEMRGDARSPAETLTLTIGATDAFFIAYAGSMFEVRALAEPLVSADEPSPMVIYIPGKSRDRHASVLMELEKAGTTWEPQLAQLARNVLLQTYTLGVVDEMLPAGRKLSYEDLAHAALGHSGAEPPSILKSIFYDANGNDALLCAWLVSDARDAQIVEKDAARELSKLLKARLGLDLAPDAPLSKWRAITLRYVLASEFRLDLLCDAPASLDSIPKPVSKDEESVVRQLARRLRENHPNAYADIADRVEEELGLKSTQTKIPPGALGAIDTFRFEERALLHHTGELIADGKFDAVLALVAQREQSFWLDRDVTRKAQWETTRCMAELGKAAAQVRKALDKTPADAAAWFDAYGSRGIDGAGWFRLDQAQRRLEAWVTKLEEDPEERALSAVRRLYEDVCRAMAEGFTKALVKSGWTVPGALHQTRIWSETVANKPKPVAFFLVDAMRYEMGVELAERLPKSSEVTVRAAAGALPSITPIGMAALMPGASASFSVAEEDGKLGACIDGRFLTDVAARKKLAAARVPGLVDMVLDDLLSLQPSKLAKKLDGAQVVIVRSQEIDHLGESGFTSAWRMMDTIIDDLARAIRKLAAAGIEHAVVSADHGHLFFATDRDVSMRTDAPGGNTLDVHRRCWIGRGGATPPGCVRVQASELGYTSDLEMVFPAALGVFKAGGDLAFHHGGPSLQEMVIPVLSVRTKARGPARSSAGSIEARGLPEAVTNRIFSVTFTHGAQQLSLDAPGLAARPLLMAAGRQVGAAGMAVDAPFDRATGCVTLEPNKPLTVVFLLSDDSVDSLRVVMQDPATDAELYRSPTDIPLRLGV